MKSLLIHGILLSFLAGTASADWIIEWKIENPQGSYNSTMKVKGTWVRTDEATAPFGPTSKILDSTTGDSVLLIHGRKLFVKTSSAQTKAVLDAAKLPDGVNNGPAVPLGPTGQSEKIGDYPCDIYTYSDTHMTWNLWVARSHPQAAALKALERQLQKLPHDGPDTSTLAGPVLKTESVHPGAMTSRVAGQRMIRTRDPLITTTTYVSIKEQEFEAREFEVPIDYRPYVAPPAPPRGN